MNESRAQGENLATLVADERRGCHARGERTAQAGPIPRDADRERKRVSVKLVATEIGRQHGVGEEIGAKISIAHQLPLGHERTGQCDIGQRMPVAVVQLCWRPAQRGVEVETDRDAQVARRRKDAFILGADPRARKTVARGAAADSVGEITLELGAEFDVFGDLGAGANRHPQVVAVQQIAEMRARVELDGAAGLEAGNLQLAQIGEMIQQIAQVPGESRLRRRSRFRRCRGRRGGGRAERHSRAEHRPDKQPAEPKRR